MYVLIIIIIFKLDTKILILWDSFTASKTYLFFPVSVFSLFGQSKYIYHHIMGQVYQDLFIKLNCLIWIHEVM